LPRPCQQKAEPKIRFFTGASKGWKEAKGYFSRSIPFFLSRKLSFLESSYFFISAEKSSVLSENFQTLFPKDCKIKISEYSGHQ